MAQVAPVSFLDSTAFSSFCKKVLRVALRVAYSAAPVWYDKVVREKAHVWRDRRRALCRGGGKHEKNSL